MEDLKTYIGQISPVTRYFMGTTFLLSFCMTYKIISPYSLFLTFEKAFKEFQLWRLVTTFFFAGEFSMNFLFGMMMTYWGVNNIEKHFAGKATDLTTLMLFNAVTVMLFGWLLGEYMVL